MADVSEHRRDIDGLPVFWRSAPSRDGAAVPLYLHGVPTNSDEWVGRAERPGSRPRWTRWWRAKRDADDWVQPAQAGFLERSGGLAPDLPGFGRSGKPGSLSYTIAEYDRFIERFLETKTVWHPVGV